MPVNERLEPVRVSGPPAKRQESRRRPGGAAPCLLCPLPIACRDDVKLSNDLVEEGVNASLKGVIGSALVSYIVAAIDEVKLTIFSYKGCVHVKTSFPTMDDSSKIHTWTIQA